MSVCQLLCGWSADHLHGNVLSGVIGSQIRVVWGTNYKLTTICISVNMESKMHGDSELPGNKIFMTCILPLAANVRSSMCMVNPKTLSVITYFATWLLILMFMKGLS